MHPDVSPDERNMRQALALFGLALVVGPFAWQGKPDLILAIFSFCVFLATSVAVTLFLIEDWLQKDGPLRLSRICLPATGILAFSASLFLAAGYPGWATFTFALAGVVAAYRKLRTEGPFNLIPATALDVSLAGGAGTALGGMFLILLGWAIT